jgi:hypothetical protein
MFFNWQRRTPSAQREQACRARIVFMALRAQRVGDHQPRIVAVAVR